MIGQLTGLVAMVEADHCLIDVHGVGYVVFASTSTLGNLPRPPETARLLVETIVREDAIQLFGFLQAEERNWFRLLTTVQGVGVRVALAILSASRPSELVLAINAGDKTVLTQAAGVGPRLALRILTELKDKIAKTPGLAGSGEALPHRLSSGTGVEISGLQQDALSGLETLGFRRAEAWPVISRLVETHGEEGLDGIIRLALRELAR